MRVVEQPHLSQGQFPRTRMRRNRRTPWSRQLVAENRLSVDDLIWPVFVIEGENKREPVPSLPGVERVSINVLVSMTEDAANLGIPAVALFPCVDPELKSPDCSEALNPDNLVCRAVRAVKAACSEIGVICDVALDPFNSDGHDGLVRGGEIVNDESLEVLCGQAVVQGIAGCDVVAPSDMMDGRIGSVRDALDASNLQSVQIMSYAAKYASAFYGPFRDAVGSAGSLKGNKRTYQMDPANSDEAIREAALDIQEGADMLIVKPGLPYLDVLSRLKGAFALPTFAYHVSGEYAMLKAASQKGWLEYDTALIESLLAFKRAGADGILSYAAVDAARLLAERYNY